MILYTHENSRNYYRIQSFSSRTYLSYTKAKQYGDVLVAICSGFYSQRGLPSLISRQDKTKLALQNGVDLVLELPACYASQSADYFAKYAIQSLSCLNVDTICFGSETNDIEYLKNTQTN